MMPGIADIVGFGPDGVTIVRNRLNAQAQVVSTDFKASQGWRKDHHVLLLADTTGDGSADLVGFGNDGVYIAVNRGDNTFDNYKKAISKFGFRASAGNWKVDDHLRYMADLRNNGRADIVAFGDAGVYVSLNNGDGTFQSPELATKEFACGPWQLNKHPRFLADTRGNGRLDIVGFGKENLYVAYGNADGTFKNAKAVLRKFCYNQGWRVDEHPRYLVDLTGDGKVDIIGFGHDAVYNSLNKGDGTFEAPKQVLQAFGKDQGWQADKHVRCVGDVTGDGCADIVGFYDDGVYVSINKGDGTFKAPQLVLSDFNYNNSWKVDEHPRFLADMTGNGRVDIVGFGPYAVFVAYNDGNGGFSAAVQIVSDMGSETPGWSLDKSVKYVVNLYR